MKKLTAVLGVFGFIASSCLTGGGGATRSILVDFNHDQFTSFFAHDFPDKVQVHPGDRVVFRQTWTGEPHTVTGGKIVDKVLAKGTLWFPFFHAFDGLRAAGVALPDPNGPPPPGTFADVLRIVQASKPSKLRSEFLSSYDALVKSGEVLPDRAHAASTPFAKVIEDVNGVTDKLFNSLPFAFGDSNVIKQNIGQRCFLKSGEPPKDEKKPCAKRNQRQPLFDGKASFYSSGIIPYLGVQGNTYEINLAKNIKPGHYFFYCAVHGPGQSEEITVRPKKSKIPSQAEVSREAQSQVRDLAAPMLKAWRAARSGTFKIAGDSLKGPFAGTGDPNSEAAVNEFIPKTFTTRVGEPVTWKIIGGNHSISFNVPKYFPIMRFAKSGAISTNPRLYRPEGGSPKIPPGKQGEVLRIDGGTYDGKGFFSSSVFGNDPYATYTLRFSRARSYSYACLIHPGMVGTLVVKP